MSWVDPWVELTINHPDAWRMGMCLAGIVLYCTALVAFLIGEKLASAQLSAPDLYQHEE